jgi:hypothetical protein
MRVAIGVLAAVVLGLLVGRITAPSSTSSTPSVLEAGSPSPGPTSESVGVGVGFSRTREGAVLAAGSYQQAFADRAILRPVELRRRIEAVATPDFEQTMLKANEPGAARLAAGSFGQGLRAGVPSAFLGVPIGYRLLSFSPSRSVVQTWGFSLIGNLSAVEPTAYCGLSQTELSWSEGDWKIADTRASFGPTPRLGSPQPGGEGIGLVELTEELRPYGLAP